MEELLQGISIGARSVVGGVMVLAAIQKLRNVRGFAATLQAYRWLPTRARWGTAVSLPLAELGLGIALLAGGYLGVTAPLAAGLFMFLGAAFAITFGLDGSGDCGCFGAGQMAETRRVLARNASLAALAVVAWSAVAFEARPGAGTLLALAGLAGLVALAMTLPRESRIARSDMGDEGRRRFLRLAGGALGGLTLAAALGVLRRAPEAEAACLGCGTCGTDYIFLYCTAPCCGAYIVSKWNNCQTYCYECSETVKIYCGVSVCC